MTTTGIPSSFVYLIDSGLVHLFPEVKSDETSVSTEINFGAYYESFSVDPAFSRTPYVGADQLILAGSPFSLEQYLTSLEVSFHMGIYSTQSLSFRSEGTDFIYTVGGVYPVYFTTANTPPTVTLSPSAQNIVFTENGAAVDVFKDVVVSTVETGQKIVAFNLSVTHADAHNDILTVDGTAITLNDGATGDTSGHGWTYAVSIDQNGVAHLAFTSTAGMYQLAFSSLIDAVSFANGSDNPATADRVISLDYLKDNGDNALGGGGGDGDTDVTGASATVHVTAVDDPATLTGLVSSVTFGENLVNATPQVIDASVTFSEPDTPLNGYVLRVSGVLAEDRIGVLDEGTGAGQIGYSNGIVCYGGVAIGTASGGNGTPFSVTFNANANAAAVEALVEHLTYADVSDDPTASRTLHITVSPETPHFIPLTGPSPLDAVSVPNYLFITAAPVDLDGDGDFDLVAADGHGGIRYFENTSSTAIPVFEARTGTASPLDGISAYGTTFADIDGDGDQDMIVHGSQSVVRFFRNVGTASSPSFQEVTGADNPFRDLSFGYTWQYQKAALADVDGDGDLDLLLSSDSGLKTAYYENVGDAHTPSYVFRDNAADPFYSNLPDTPSGQFADLDNDGDLDLVLGDLNGGASVYVNTGTVQAPHFQFAAKIAFNGEEGDAALVDLDGDGDADLILSQFDAAKYRFTLNPYINTGASATITVNVTPQVDAPIVTATGADVTYVENGNGVDLFSNVHIDTVEPGQKVKALTLTVSHAESGADVVTVDGTSIVLSAGASGATTGHGLTYTVAFSGGTATLTLSNAAGVDPSDVESIIDGMRFGSNSENPSTADRTITLTSLQDTGGTANGGHDTSALNIAATVHVTAVDDPATLTGLASSVTFGENLVNATPQVIDASVTFSEPDTPLNGFVLRVSGVLAEDRIGVLDEGSGAGQIGYSNGTVTYGGVAIGTASGGNGTPFSVTFNSNATAGAVEALVEHLTYADVSNDPTASRTLHITVSAASPHFIQLTGPSPLDTVSLPHYNYAAVSMVDLDGDGDLDLVSSGGELHYFENTSSTAIPAYVERSGTANPLHGISTNGAAFGDVDGDGDQDMISEDSSGNLHYFRNIGTAAVPAFEEKFGSNNPFNGVSFGTGYYYAKPALADIDGDGDLDLLINTHTGLYATYYKNVGDAEHPADSLQSAATDPFPDTLSVAPSGQFADLDNDGDLDLVVGNASTGAIIYLNTGTAETPSFQYDAYVPGRFNYADAALADLDGDGDSDLILTAYDFNEGQPVLTPYINAGASASVTVNVTSQNDAPTLSATAASASFTENGSSVDLFSNVQINTVEAGQKIKALTLTVSHANSGADVLTVDGTAIVLSSGATGATAGHGLSYAVTFSGGTATLTLSKADGVATSDIQAVIAGMTFGSNSDDPSTVDRTITLTSLKDTGGTANGGHDTTTLAVASHVTVVSVNDDPTLSATGVVATFTENGSSVDLFSNVHIDTVEAGQKIKALTLTVSHADSGADVVTVDGTAIVLSAGVTGATTGHGLTYTVTFSGGTATLTLSKADGVATSDMQAIIDGMTFGSNSENPSTVDRTITLTSLKDTGGTANSGHDASVLNIAASVHVTPVNDPATLTLTHTVTSLSAATSTAQHIKVADISISDIDGGANALSLSGADKAMFEISGGKLYLKAGAVLNYAANPVLDVTVNVDDPTVPGSPDDHKSLSIQLTSALNITGDDRGNRLTGGGAGERIDGRGGNDTIVGNGGDDTIIGGTGYDKMTGGPGRDVFVFKSVADSPYSGPAWHWDESYANGAGHRDIITDFVHGTDRMDLSAIDANPAAPHDQTFTFRGTGPIVKAPGQLYVDYFRVNGQDVTIVSADTDGNGAPELQIELRGHINLNAGDFVL